jgi:Bifunctional DNA primase/polymerase, N-terminal
MSEKLIDVALRLADNGFAIFPVATDKKPCWSNEELGLARGQGGLKMATTDLEEVEKLFGHPRAAGIGYPTGKVNNLTVVDVDLGKNKPNRLSAMEWLDEHRKALLGATVVRTMSGGLHYLCRFTPEIPSAANVWAMGVDCRNTGGYAIYPPFMGYRFERQTDPDDWPAPPPAPAARIRRAIVDLKDGKCPTEIMAMRDLIEQGVTWHDPVRDIIAHLVGSGWSDAEILRFTFQWTWAGHQPAETFEQLCVMINGARDKWTRKDDPTTTEEAKLWKLADTWNRSAPATRKTFFDMIRESELKDSEGQND